MWSAYRSAITSYPRSTRRWRSSTASVAEVPATGDHDAHPARLGDREHLVVSDRATRMDHGGHTRVGGHLDRVGEREERVARHDRTLRAVARLASRDERGVNPGHLPGADPNGR